MRWERSRGPQFLQDMMKLRTGAIFRTDDSFTPSAVASKWAEVQDFTDPEHPANSEDGDMMVSSSKCYTAQLIR